MDLTHISIESFPIWVGEKFCNVLQLACPIPLTGRVPTLESAFMIPAM